MLMDGNVSPVQRDLMLLVVYAIVILLLNVQPGEEAAQSSLFHLVRYAFLPFIFLLLSTALC